MINQQLLRLNVLKNLAGAIVFPSAIIASPERTTHRDLSYLDVYNNKIDRNLLLIQGIHNISPGRNLIKSMITVESGPTKDAFEKDPMQIANEGDFALEVL